MNRILLLKKELHSTSLTIEKTAEKDLDFERTSRMKLKINERLSGYYEFVKDENKI